MKTDPRHPNAVRTAKLFLLLLALGAAVLLIIRLATSGGPENVAYQLARVARQNFEITVNTVGVLDAERSHMVSSRIKGDKGKIIFLVNDGARVQKGDVLVKLDPAPFEEEVQSLESDVQSLDAAVESAEQLLEWEKNQVEREMKTAQYNLKVARLELRKLVEGEGPMQSVQLKEERDKAREECDAYAAYITDLDNLIKNGYAHENELRLARKKHRELEEKFTGAQHKYTSYEQHVLPALTEAARAKVEACQVEMEQIKKGSVFKIAKAFAGLKEVQAKLQSARELLRQARGQLAQTVLKAPFSGIAILYETFRDGQKRKPRVGDRVLQHQPLLYLPDISAMIVNTRIREVDLYKIETDQTCRVDIDAYPDEHFQGQVTHVGALASGDGEGIGEKYFQLVITVNGENAKLRPGMTARVSILVDRVVNVLAVPIHAVFKDDGSPCGYRYTQNGFVKVPLVLGRQNEDLAEIRSGLAPGDRVSLIKPEAKDIRSN